MCKYVRNSTNGRRTVDDFSTNRRRIFDELSTNRRRTVDEFSTNVCHRDEYSTSFQQSCCNSTNSLEINKTKLQLRQRFFESSTNRRRNFDDPSTKFRESSTNRRRNFDEMSMNACRHMFVCIHEHT